MNEFQAAKYLFPLSKGYNPRHKMTASISDAAAFWASIATLLAASGAWFTYYASVRAAHNQDDDAIRNLIAGIRSELSLISPWASGEEGDVGYLQSKTLGELRQEHRDWINPSRVVYTFDCPTITNITSSPHLRRLQPILQSLVRLNYSIVRLFDYYREYRHYAMQRPVLFDSVMKKLGSSNQTLAFDEAEYVQQIFAYNVQIHASLIGGIDSGDEGCLYKAFRAARHSVDAFAENLSSEPLPWWFWILHGIAVALFLKAVLLIFAWFGVDLAAVLLRVR